eukprot:CAMPEP_0197517118 /NCGR_PEP_ID=MMETSP1318-20131121/2087_1 /TAXON_ID=552666 /ORGANISM="Partenskyella glossopodia, Strain RCC365" /LENGTH=453 /DNA_ID=CAMNT_0043066419 /DNA_START=1 /DNA_END=1362 /DNA_ORIENTATION=+
MSESSGYEIAGLTADMEPSGRWYLLAECQLMENGKYYVKVADTEESREAGMDNAISEGIEPEYIRKIGLAGNIAQENHPPQDKKYLPDEEGDVGITEGGEREGAETTNTNTNITTTITTHDANQKPAEGSVAEAAAENTSDVATQNARVDTTDDHVDTDVVGPEPSVQERSTKQSNSQLEVGSGSGSYGESTKDDDDDDNFHDDFKQITPQDFETLSREELIERLTSAEIRSRKAETTIQKWETGIRQILNCIILSPMMNHFYRQKLTKTLESVLTKVDSISRVVYIHCSFPSIDKEFPIVKLNDWNSLAKSAWHMTWTPSWHISARIEGSHYLSFTLNIAIHKLKVMGDFNLSCKKDLSAITISFHEMPEVSLEVGTSIALGILPIPLSIMQESISTQVKIAFMAWLEKSLVEPNSMTFPCLRNGGYYTDDAILEEAKAAAKLANLSVLPDF